jgi:hypothetical protein
MADQKTESDLLSPWRQLIENRKERAEYYFDNVLAGQQHWYSEKSGEQKTRHLMFAIVVIVIGALISVLQVFSGQVWVAGATAVLGATVAVLRSIDTLLRPHDTWQAYRKASEGMKREYRLYLNNADAYAQADDEDAAYRLLVERVETVIAEEQQLFWQFHATTQVVSEARNPDNEDFEEIRESAESKDSADS